MRNVLFASLKFNRRHIGAYLTRFALFMLCAFIITSEILFLYGSGLSIAEETESRYGRQDFIINMVNWPDEMYDDIADDERVSEIGITVFYADDTKVGEMPRDALTVGNMDEKALSIHGIEVISGRMPEAVGEIAVDAAVLRLKYPGLELGDSFDMELSNWKLFWEKKTFRLVGILEDYVGIQSTLMEDDCPFPTLPSALITPETAEAFGLTSPEGYLSSLSVVLNGTSDGQWEKELRRKQNVSQIVGNGKENNPIVKEFESSGVYVMAAGAALVLITVVFALAYISVSEKEAKRTRAGRLRIAGYTPHGVTAVFVTDSLLAAAPGAVVGCGLGIIAAKFLIGAFLPFGKLHFAVWIPLVAFAVTVVLSAVITVASASRFGKLTVNELINPDMSAADGKVRVGRFTRKIRNVTALLGLRKHANGKSGAILRIFIYLTLFTMMISSLYVGYLRAGAYSNGSYDVMLWRSGYFTLDRDGFIPTSPYTGLEKPYYDLLKRNSVADDIIGMKFIFAFSDIAADVEWNGDAYVEKYGFKVENSLCPEALTGLNNEAITTRIANYINVDPKLLSDGKHAVLVYGDYPSEDDAIQRKHINDKYAVGTKFHIQTFVNDSPNGRIVEFDFEIIAHIDKAVLSDEDKALMNIKNGFVFNECVFDAAELPLNYDTVFATADKSRPLDDFYAAIDDVSNNYRGSISVKNNLANAEEVSKLAETDVTIGWVTSAVLGFFAVLSLAATVNSQVKRDRCELGMLTAVGMNKRKLYAVYLIGTLGDVIRASVTAIAVATVTGVYYQSRERLEQFFDPRMISRRTLFECISFDYTLMNYGAVLLVIAAFAVLSALACIVPVLKLSSKPVANLLSEKE